MTEIEWTQKTWNPLVGCSKISSGCANCYAINQAHRNAAMAQVMPNPGRLKYYEGLTEKQGNRLEWTGLVRFVPEALEIPPKTKKPTTWFVNSMSDLFHESVTDEQLDQVFAVMVLTPQHKYQVLTKRPRRMLEYCKDLDLRRLLKAVDLPLPFGNYEIKLPLPNVWLGVTVENQKAANERISLLLQTPAAIRFLSCEPLLECVEIDCIKHVHTWEDGGKEEFAAWNPLNPSDGSKIDWVIVGGESGPKARPFEIAWARSIIQQCKDAGVPVFVKQLGTRNNWTMNKKGSSTKGNNPDEWPEDLRVREMPRLLGGS